ncbi:MAG: ABC transporter permease [Thermodesulfobacteriota bacterium]
MQKINNIYNLGIKELISLRFDIVLIFLIVYGYTALVYMAASDESLELRNASIAIVNEDQSSLSYRIEEAFLDPYFLQPENLQISDVDTAMDTGRYTFVVDIPPNFEADVVSGRKPDIQVNIDATAMSQAGIGAGYISQIITEETTEFLKGYKYESTQPVGLNIRVKFNPNLEGSWFSGVMEIINITTLIAILISGAAIIREREHGTIDHLLVMPLRPFEIMAAKFWANGLVILTAILFSLIFVIKLLLQVHIEGSILLFIVGTLLYLFSIISIGIFLATVARSMPQLGLLSILVVFPMLLLSGGYTPLDSMPGIIEIITTLSPTRHFVSFAQSVLFRGAELQMVWRDFFAVAAIGAIFFVGALIRFRKTVALTYL